MRDTKPKVLMVDDVPANLLALTALLEDTPCELVSASSGNDALRQLLRHEFALILLDVQMPDMDGYEVARFARESPHSRDVPIVFLTANRDAEDGLLRAYESGGVDILFKPINPAVLRSKVRIFLELYMSRRKLADAVLEKERMLADLESFSYSVSHDLRAPLRPLDGFSRVLLEDYGDLLDEQAKGYLNRIRAASQKMSLLIEDLLRLSRVGRAELRHQEIDVGVIAGAVVDELRKTDPERKVAFASSAAPANADKNLVTIALENLLRNAWKFTRGKPEASIEVGIREMGGETAYFVKDDGVGFDPTYASKLFKPFQRLHAATDFEGTGIGLAIVNRVVRHHGGRAWAESSPGAGATFWFTLQPSAARAAPT